MSINCTAYVPFISVIGSFITVHFNDVSIPVMILGPVNEGPLDVNTSERVLNINTNIKSIRLRKSWPRMLAASIVIRSENGAPITTPTLTENGRRCFNRQKDRPREGSMLLVHKFLIYYFPS